MIAIYRSPGDRRRSLKFLIAIIYWPANCTAAISCGRVSAGIQPMSCQWSPPTVVCSRRMRAGGNGGRHDQHSCEGLVKALQCWWAPAAASLSTLARRHQLSDYTHGRSTSHTKCARLVTDAQRQRPDKKTDFNHQGALTSRSQSRSDRGVTMSRSSITQIIPRAQPYVGVWML